MGALTASLGAGYLGSVVFLQYAFGTLTGGEAQLAVVVSILAIATLFSLLRRRIQMFRERPFYRKSTTRPGSSKPSPPSCAKKRISAF